MAGSGSRSGGGRKAGGKTGPMVQLALSGTGVADSEVRSRVVRQKTGEQLTAQADRVTRKLYQRARQSMDAGVSRAMIGISSTNRRLNRVGRFMESQGWRYQNGGDHIHLTEHIKPGWVRTRTAAKLDALPSSRKRRRSA